MKPATPTKPTGATIMLMCGSRHEAAQFVYAQPVPEEIRRQLAHACGTVSRVYRQKKHPRRNG